MQATPLPVKFQFCLPFQKLEKILRAAVTSCSDAAGDVRMRKSPALLPGFPGGLDD
jgi:hypothetical protein